MEYVNRKQTYLLDQVESALKNDAMKHDIYIYNMPGIF